MIYTLFVLHFLFIRRTTVRSLAKRETEDEATLFPGNRRTTTATRSRIATRPRHVCPDRGCPTLDSSMISFCGQRTPHNRMVFHYFLYIGRSTLTFTSLTGTDYVGKGGSFWRRAKPSPGDGGKRQIQATETGFHYHTFPFGFLGRQSGIRDHGGTGSRDGQRDGNTGEPKDWLMNFTVHFSLSSPRAVYLQRGSGPPDGGGDRYRKEKGRVLPLPHGPGKRG